MDTACIDQLVKMGETFYAAWGRPTAKDLVVWYIFDEDRTALVPAECSSVAYC